MSLPSYSIDAYDTCKAVVRLQVFLKNVDHSVDKELIIKFFLYGIEIFLMLYYTYNRNIMKKPTKGAAYV